MTTIDDTLKQGLESLKSQEAALVAELAKVRAVIASMEKALGVESRVPRSPRGHLNDTIRGLLSHTKHMSNSDIRTALTKSEYPYSATQQMVSRALTTLVRSKVAKRIGEHTDATYILAPGKS